MNSKPEPIQSLPSLFVKLPTAILDLLAAGKVSCTAVCLWSIIKAYCCQKETCFPSIPTLSRHLNCSREWTGTLVEQLKTKGLLEIERRKGRSHIYRPISPNEPVNTTSQVDDDLLTPLHTGVNSTSQPPANSTSHEVDIFNQNDLIRDKSLSSDTNRGGKAKKRQSEKSPSKKDPPDHRVKDLINHWCHQYEASIGVV